MSGYGMCFLRGGMDWPNGLVLPPSPAFVSRAGTLFLRGGFDQVDYCRDPSLPAPLSWREPGECGVAAAVANQEAIVGSGSNVATREIRQRDSFVDARIRIRPPVNSTAYAIEEKVPPGLAASDIRHGGLYYALRNSIRWGPFLDNEPRDLTYRLIAEDGSKSTDLFEGIVSFDGYDTLIEGDRAIATLHGDADRDGDVDVADYLQLVECFSATATPIASDCDVFDFDGDGHVGLADLVAFQSAFTGTR